MGGESAVGPEDSASKPTLCHNHIKSPSNLSPQPCSVHERWDKTEYCSKERHNQRYHALVISQVSNDNQPCRYHYDDPRHEVMCRVVCKLVVAMVYFIKSTSHQRYMTHDHQLQA